MFAPRVALEVMPAVSPSSSSVVVRLMLANPTETAMDTPLPDSWRQAIGATMTSPDGQQRTWTPFHATGAIASNGRLSIFEGAELEASFSVPGAWLSEAGTYRVSAALTYPDGTLAFPDAEFEVETVERVELACADAHMDEETVLPAWILVATRTTANMKRANVDLSDITGLPRMTPAGEFVTLPVHAHGLTASGEFVLWVCGTSLCAGFMSYEFVQTTLALPGALRRIVSAVRRADGGVRASVLSADDRSLWIVDVDALQDPWPSPVLAAAVHFPEAACGVAVSPTAVAYVTDGEVRFSPSIEAAANGSFRAIRIGRAHPLPGADPVLTVDQDGRFHLLLLVCSADLGLIHLAFDQDGEPVVAPGLGWENFGALPAAPAAAFLRANGGVVDWCVAMADGRTMARQGGQPVTTSTLPATPARRMIALGAEGRLAVAVQEQTDIWFAEV